jgi:N utilization substance protein B
MGQRRQSREAAMKYLYQVDCHVESLTENTAKFIQHFRVEDSAQDFFLQLAEGVLSNQEEIDPLLEEAAEHWKLYRMGKVDRALLRMACYELLKCPETDYQVVIDEAVELAKMYGSTDSASFVNGILDRLSKKIRGHGPELEMEKQEAS